MREKRPFFRKVARFTNPLLVAALATSLVVRVLESGSESRPWLLYTELMYPHRAWDSGLDQQAGRGYAQPQPGKQLTGVQGQSAEVSWQGQVRGNPAAEYAALVQARAASSIDVKHLVWWQ